MNIIYLLLSIISITILFLVFIVGYLIGKLSTLNGVSKNNKLFVKNNDSIQEFIDDSKFVVKIETDNLQKKYKELGEIKSSEENIANSVSKLKNMKG